MQKLYVIQTFNKTEKTCDILQYAFNDFSEAEHYVEKEYIPSMKDEMCCIQKCNFDIKKTHGEWGIIIRNEFSTPITLIFIQIHAVYL